MKRKYGGNGESRIRHGNQTRCGGREIAVWSIIWMTDERIFRSLSTRVEVRVPKKGPQHVANKIEICYRGFDAGAGDQADEGSIEQYSVEPELLHTILGYLDRIRRVAEVW